MISGNGGDGVNIINHNATVTIKRNLIGINAGQSGALANAGYGVEIKDPSSFATANILIGSKDSPFDFNVISGQRELRNLHRRESWERSNLRKPDWA